jgi:hypothetical protein
MTKNRILKVSELKTLEVFRKKLIPNANEKALVL